MDEPPTPPSQEGPEASLMSSDISHQQSSEPSVLVASEISSTNPVRSEMQTHSLSIPEQKTEPSLFVPQNNSDTLEVQALSKTSDPSIKKERSVTPPPKALLYSPSGPKYRFSSDVIDLTADDDDMSTGLSPRQKIIGITSDGEYEDIDPSPRRYKPIKRESQSPKYRRKVSEDVEDVLMTLKDEELPDGSDIMVDDEDASDGSSVEVASPIARSSRGQASAPSQKETKRRKAQGKRAKTAREWHQRHQAKLSESQLRGTAYKLARINKIREDMKKGVKKRRAVKLSKRRAATRPSPRVFLNGGMDNLDSTSAHREDVSTRGQPELHASTRRGFWKEFTEKIHNEIDLHRCKGDWNDLVKGARSLGYRQLFLKDGKWRHLKLASSLLNHQVFGVEFMVKRECALDGPHGSIVADDMLIMDMQGMGKTVQTIARSQWLREIRKHAPELGDSVMQFKAADPDNSATRLKMNDIVLTTYWEMCQSLPNPDKKTVESWKADNLNLFEQYKKWVEDNADLKGLLHQITWYRIVLDEGHYIKNYKSRTSRAAIELKGDLRLLLSGVIFPKSMFLGRLLTLPDADHELLRSRTMKDLLFGERIVKLPLDHRSIKPIDAKRSEELLYFAIELRLKELRQMDFKEEDERSRLQNPLAQLTRLRQLTANPDIIAQQIIVLLKYEEIRKLQKTIGEMRVPGKPKSVASMLYSNKREGVYAKASLEADDVVAWMKCKEPSEELYSLKKCSHIFCEACLEENIIRDMEESGEEVMYCPECSKPYTESHIKPLSQLKASGKAAGKERNESTRKGKDAKGFRPTPALNQFCFMKWLERLDERKIKLLPSAKLEAICDQVLEWNVEAPQDKIIIFSQFRHFQVMIGCMLEKEKQKFLYFSGDMSSKQRESAVLQFESDPSIKIMVAGLKCGGLGLNLSFANRVLITDIWWNVCIDNQAFGRVFRIGQEKESQYVKVVRKETVDERTILALQRKKEAAINNVMQDDITKADFDKILGGKPEETFKELMARYSADGHIANSDDDMPDLHEI
ncbi:hypothetical protein BKA64DRAFT_720586 [Cadophora sp. MPI-SDFR-AT-0126]|nr:hypothetical protein BKA64DRAFT_720586 [Leotiomycetes sp. MPI-SDFR-AT-0126]